ncbi:hypothetical protein Tco_1445958 [Tanacetum coccineum]
MRISRLHTLLFPANLEGYQILDPKSCPPSPDYIPGLEEPQSPPLPDFVPEPVYPEFMLPEDEILPAEEQLLPAADSPTADSPGYIPESDPEEDPEEDDDEDPEEDPADYPADRGDDGDDEDEPSDDDKDEEVDIKADDEEEEEHPTPADSTAVALPAIDQASSAEETKPFETDESAATPPPHPAYRVTARISIPAPVPTTVWSDAEVFRLLAISTPPSSPLSPWSSSFPQIPSPPLPPILSPLPVSPPLPQIPSPPLPVSPSLPVSAPPPASPIRLLGYRAAIIRLRAEAASTSHSLPLPPLSPIPAPTPSPPLLLPSTNRREDRTSLPYRLERGLRVDYGFVATMDREIRRDLERDVGYGITDSWDKIVEAMQGTLVVTDVAEFSQRMTEFETRAWGQSMDASDLMRAEVMSLHTQVVAQQAVITELQVADHRRQMVITEMLAADHKRQVQLTKALKLLKGPQTQMEELQRQQGPANGPAQPDAPEEAGSSS